MNRYLNALISQGENQTLDFKFEISDAKKIARTFSAFANTCGGRLLIGVKDNGVVTGIKTDEEAYMAESAAHIYCNPPVEYSAEIHREGQKTVLEIIIPESKTKPHKAPWKNDSWKAFIRSDDENFLASPVIIRAWQQKLGTINTLVRYNDFEQKLFALLKSKNEITLKEFYKKNKIPPQLAIKIMANLITIDILQYRVTEDETYFSLSSCCG